MGETGNITWVVAAHILFLNVVFKDFRYDSWRFLPGIRKILSNYAMSFLLQIILEKLTLSYTASEKSRNYLRR